MLNKAHNRLIRWVVGSKPVVMNVTINNRGIAISDKDPLIANCLIDVT